MNKTHRPTPHEVNVKEAVRARRSMDEIGLRMQERDHEHHTGSSKWLDRMQRLIDPWTF